MGKNLKKICAFLVLMTMVLAAMSINVFAADSTNIDIKYDIPEDAVGVKYQYLHLIKPDTTKPTGWTFVNEVASNAFKDAFAPESDEQAIIGKLIEIQKKRANHETHIDDAKVTAAIEAVANTATVLSGEVDTVTVSEAGLYYIKGIKDKYAFNPMAAYVSFGEYDRSTGVPGPLESAGVKAKYSKIPVKKESDDNKKDDGIIHINQEVEYKIESVVPFISSTTQNRYYVIKDSISGAEYLTEKVDEKIVIKDLKVVVGSGTITGATAIVNEAGNGFTLDLTEALLKENSKDTNKYANQSIVVTYKAKVTGVRVNNTVQIGKGENGPADEWGSDEDSLIGGKVTMIKTGENNAPLADAKFIVYKEVDAAEKYAKLTEKTEENDAGETIKRWWEFDQWVDKESDATKIVTGADGTAAVYGLDAKDKQEYKFKETDAPKGYSINETDSTAAFGNATFESGDDKDLYKADASMADTKLSALPSTGGMGTYIFTIVGVGVMAVMAGMFFIKRRREAVNDK